ncbi:LysM peptidoglycan-binding domain-containing protein [Demequina lignilytica]|uniref:LysM peptidoglycan-binding domain-containing protein n=1 Tax=Demequina lignilytica TaxID=3051663 RepID=A0AB35MJM8_9MICO|nr:LysM peptidoglycan-binding domain-containing protein [Demequina sp. SYSU T0a273]MDN4483983.1 LysM peptidoglycan-binding domain-containing protein [Demequina sp. SYSU T0a273]
MSIYAPQNPVARARRARTGRVLALVLAVLGAAVVGPQAFATEAGDVAPVVADTYTVGSGETLWGIAVSRTEPGEDVRDTVVEIQQLNAMSGGDLRAGDQIYVPVAG